MTWYLFAFLPPLLWAMSNHIDKYLLSKYLKNSNTSVLAMFAGLVGFLFSLFVLIIAPENLLEISLLNAIIIILNGALLIVSFIPYYYALNTEDASAVAPLYQTIPIFSFVLGFLVLGESISTIQIIAGLFIIAGSVLISLDAAHSGFKVKMKVLLLMLLSSLLLAIHFVVFKVIALEESFWVTVFWEYIGASSVAVYMLLFAPENRRQFIAMLKTNSAGIITLSVFNEVINISAKLLANYATLLVPVVVVNLANGLQPLFIFLIGVILTFFLPHIGTEGMTKRHIIQRTIAIAVLFIGTYLLVV